MESIFIVVVSSETKQATNLRKTNTKERALDIIANIKNDDNVDRVFSVDELGHVTHFNVVFEGKLKLQEVLF